MSKRAKKKPNRAALRRDFLPREPMALELIQFALEKLGGSRDKLAILTNDASSQMSRLMTGHIDEFSADRIVGHLTKVGYSVNVQLVRPHPAMNPTRPKRGKVSVKVYNNRGYSVRA